MGPIEIVFLTIQVIIAAVGVVRGYARELGNTLVFMIAIFLLSYLGVRGQPFLEQFGQIVFGFQPDSTQMDAFLMLIYCGAFLAVVFASYAGKTLDFGGKELPAPEGTIMSLAVGLLNGYLVAGTLWYYANEFNYPFTNVNTTEFTPLAQAMLNYLPQTVVANPVAWMVPVGLLILLRVRG